MKDALKALIQAGLAAACEDGTLVESELSDIQLEVPAHKQHGDFSTNVAMTMAKAQRKAPRQIAEALVAAMTATDAAGDEICTKIEIAGPGFINFYLNDGCWYRVLDTIAKQGEKYGLSNVGKGEKVQVEFVSANPTGPLHIGHGRGAAVGDAVAELLGAIGFDVQREYYVNDAGNQVQILGRSIWLRLKELGGETVDFPEDGYQGDYIKEIAAELKEAKGAEIAGMSEEDAIPACRDFGIEAMLGRIGNDLETFGITFDRWYSEQSLYTEGLVEKELNKLKELGLTFEEEGALWLRTTDYGDDKDRVLYRSDGNPTYFASDVAYHMEKFDRGFQTVIDVWGADHHGYIPRMKAMLAGLGRRPEDLQVLMIQLVNLLRNGQPVAMGKRSGEFVTLRDVVDEVGKDACRFFFLMRRSDSSLDFDLELAKEQSSDNPVYYVQYAHARVCSINRNAAEAGFEVPAVGEVDYSPLVLPEELELAKVLARYPESVISAGINHEPHRLVNYLQDLAATFHSYYNKQKVVVDDKAETLARLALVNCVRTVVANGLGLLGLSAPEKM